MSGIRSLRRGSVAQGYASATSAPVYIDADDNILKVIPAGSGTTEVQLVDASSTQTLTAKTLTAPAISAPVLSGTATGTYTLAGTPTLTAPIINDATGASALVAAGGTLTLTAATHSDKTIALDTAAGSIVTLPTSTGGGARYRFLVTVTATSNSHVIKVGNATDEMRGFVIQDSDSATAPNTWWAADNDDTITLNRTTTGLAAQGEYFEIVDAVSAHYYVQGYSQASGTEATPFSATV